MRRGGKGGRKNKNVKQKREGGEEEDWEKDCEEEEGKDNVNETKKVKEEGEWIEKEDEELL